MFQYSEKFRKRLEYVSWTLQFRQKWARNCTICDFFHFHSANEFLGTALQQCDIEKEKIPSISLGRASTKTASFNLILTFIIITSSSTSSPKHHFDHCQLANPQSPCSGRSRGSRSERGSHSPGILSFYTDQQNKCHEINVFYSKPLLRIKGRGVVKGLLGFLDALASLEEAFGTHWLMVSQTFSFVPSI